jgi:hypothetical protein
VEANDQAAGYKIWGADNVVYGPVELPTLVTWIQEERVLASTWVYKEADDTWKKAAQYEELSLFFRSRPTGNTTAFATGKAAALKPGALRRVKIFAGMSDAQLARFVAYMHVQEVRQWSEIVRQNSPGDAMYLLLEGEARVRLRIHDREKTLVTLAPG